MVSEFKHITVSAEPDEDVVIHAGLPASDGREADRFQSGTVQNDSVDGMGSQPADESEEPKGEAPRMVKEPKGETHQKEPFGESPQMAQMVETGDGGPSGSAVEMPCDGAGAKEPGGTEAGDCGARKTAPAEADSGFGDLTLEDLKAPMPLKQRVVIVAAVICLIGAIVYCLAFMR